MAADGSPAAWEARQGARVRQSVPADAEAIVASLRPADAAELWASNRTTGAECMAFGMRYGDQSWAGTVDGEPVCMFGVVPASLLGRVGVPWMVGTTAMDRLRVQKALLHESRPALQAMFSRYDVLANVVDARNAAAIRWLRWLGFTVSDEAVPYGPDRQPFHTFHMRGSRDV